MFGAHESVLLMPSVDGLNIVPDGIYVDGTFGRGGHSQAILDRLGPNGALVAIDKDTTALACAAERFGHDKRFSIVNASFANIDAIAKEKGIEKRISGILLDLGVSSPQLDDPMRGFSFMNNGPLDMRMNPEQVLSAETFINAASEDQMSDVFKTYGEEKFARRIARAIVRAREEQGPIKTTAVLAEVVKQANPKWEKHKHPATRVFQAIRIHVNHELKDLEEGLGKCVGVLAVGGRLAVISFHSLEDRIVKHFMRKSSEGERLPIGLPVKAVEVNTGFKRVGKAIKPSDEEMKRNVRARSAVLRIGEKTL